MSCFRKSAPLLAPHDGVRMAIERGSDRLWINYWGTLDELAAAGCAPRELLGPGRKGVKRCDSDGDHVMLLACRKGHRLIRVKPAAGAEALPGVTEWLLSNPPGCISGRDPAFQRFLGTALGVSLLPAG